MTWSYSQSTGELRQAGRVVARGYSGAGKTKEAGRNNPVMEAVVATGPIPRGLWRIGPAYKNANLGPICMNLDPVGHDAHGRTLFRIHGNNRVDDASHGCIILGPTIRTMIAQSADKMLEVTE
ncbi:tlde1 domain-containing protein [Caulobacter rhizosphaerae]|uniref:tlde1 domain-containing protein n=1 Tax=Caulobacter rhizosphaerae TaxID=2010972 RepID=UPI0013D610D1|nr:tlde1 domain-containing protein [Caulobacter rhizosphaerae]GGL48544.1 hypothetical protein GCM10010983_52370 [Caulobacter rhizosphaerae]